MNLQDIDGNFVEILKRLSLVTVPSRNESVISGLAAMQPPRSSHSPCPDRELRLIDVRTSYNILVSEAALYWAAQGLFICMRAIKACKSWLLILTPDLPQTLTDGDPLSKLKKLLCSLW